MRPAVSALPPWFPVGPGGACASAPPPSPRASEVISARVSSLGDPVSFLPLRPSLCLPRLLSWQTAGAGVRTTVSLCRLSPDGESGLNHANSSWARTASPEGSSGCIQSRNHCSPGATPSPFSFLKELGRQLRTWQGLGPVECEVGRDPWASK